MIRLETSATCEDPGDIVNVSIDERSALRFGYQPVPYPADLALYPLPFAQQGLVRIPTTIILPDEPTAGDLSAAATIAAGLGQGSGGAIDLRAILAHDFDLALHGEHHLILIGKPGTNAMILCASTQSIVRPNDFCTARRDLSVFSSCSLKTGKQYPPFFHPISYP